MGMDGRDRKNIGEQDRNEGNYPNSIHVADQIFSIWERMKVFSAVYLSTQRG